MANHDFNNKDVFIFAILLLIINRSKLLIYKNNCFLIVNLSGDYSYYLMDL